MDMQQWDEFRTNVLEQVERRLDAVKEAAEALDPITGRFEATITLDTGTGNLAERVRWETDLYDLDDLPEDAAEIQEASRDRL